MKSLDDFLAGAPAAAPVVEAPVAVEEPPEPESTEPKGVIEIILPSGIEVYFQESPKRFYRIRKHPDGETEITEEYDWREVVSTTEVTKILDKPGLVHWGEEMGVHGVQELVRRGYVDEATLKTWSTEMVRDVMKQKGLRHWQARDTAGKRGTSVHRALESWAMTGTYMSPEAFPQDEQGYVVGLNRFLADSGFVPLKSEVIVASMIHGFAGRFDLMGEIPEPVKLTTHITRSGNTREETVQPDSFLVDLKTSSGVYDEYHLQVAGYQGILEESGYERPNQTAILRTTSDGKYEFVQGVAEWLDFWWCKGLFDSLKEIKERAK